MNIAWIILIDVVRNWSQQFYNQKLIVQLLNNRREEIRLKFFKLLFICFRNSDNDMKDTNEVQAVIKVTECHVS